MFRGIRGAVTRFADADGFFLGAALAFFFMVSLIPLTLLAVSTVGFVLSQERAAAEVVAQVARMFPVYKREITSVLLRIVATRTASGLLGTVILILFATPLFAACRTVMHRLTGVRVGGGFLRGMLLDAAMALLFGILLFGASTATWLLHWFQTFVLEPAGVPGQWIEASSLGFSLALSAAMFYVGFRYASRRRVGVGAALAGAVLASVLWEAAKQLFRLYILRVGLYDQIYGPLGVLVAFVMFVYYSALVFVFGAAYATALDSRRR